jgi:hypothetical protein
MTVLLGYLSRENAADLALFPDMRFGVRSRRPPVYQGP